MVYYINGLSQESLLKKDLDVKQSLLISWFLHFMQSGNMKSKEINGELHYWISYQYLIEQFPVLKFSKKMLQRLFRDLIQKGIFDMKVLKCQAGTFTYFRPTLELYKLTREHQEMEAIDDFFCTSPKVDKEVVDKGQKRPTKDSKTDINNQALNPLVNNPIGLLTLSPMQDGGREGAPAPEGPSEQEPDNSAEDEDSHGSLEDEEPPCQTCETPENCEVCGSSDMRGTPGPEGDEPPRGEQTTPPPSFFQRFFRGKEARRARLTTPPPEKSGTRVHDIRGKEKTENEVLAMILSRVERLTEVIPAMQTKINNNTIRTGKAVFEIREEMEKVKTRMKPRRRRKYRPTEEEMDESYGNRCKQAMTPGSSKGW